MLLIYNLSEHDATRQTSGLYVIKTFIIERMETITAPEPASVSDDLSDGSALLRAGVCMRICIIHGAKRSGKKPVSRNNNLVKTSVPCQLLYAHFQSSKPELLHHVRCVFSYTARTLWSWIQIPLGA